MRKLESSRAFWIVIYLGEWWGFIWIIWGLLVACRCQELQCFLIILYLELSTDLVWLNSNIFHTSNYKALLWWLWWLSWLWDTSYSSKCYRWAVVGLCQEIICKSANFVVGKFCSSIVVIRWLTRYTYMMKWIKWQALTVLSLSCDNIIRPFFYLELGGFRLKS